MTDIIIEISRYVLILLMGIYTYESFRVFRYRDEEKQNRIFRRQRGLILLFHGLACLILYLKAGEELQSRILIFYAAQLVFFLVYWVLYRLCYRNSSGLLQNHMSMMMAVGLVMLTRISLAKSQPLELAVRQFALIVVSAAVTWVIPLIMDRVWQLSRIPWVYGILGLALLALVCAAGSYSNGAKLSLSVGGISVQPSEFVKISFVFFAATMLHRSTELRSVAVTTTAAAAHVLILVLSRDLGSALIFFVAYLSMLFVATSSWICLGLGLGGAAAASAAAYRLFSHIRVRVSAWLDPWSDIDNRGYQITQSLFAMGTGGWLGLGLCQGMPYRVPVVEKDFIFSAVCEELGGIFGVCLTLICLGCFLQFMMIAVNMQAMFYKLIAFGLGMVYITQVFLTVGGAMKFIPSTGVTLPLVSYGGSSVLSTFMLFGVIQGLYLLKKNEEEEYE